MKKFKQRNQRHVKVRYDEFGVLYDPTKATIDSIQQPDGRWIKAEGKKKGLSTLIDPQYFIARPNDNNPHITLAYRQAEMLFLMNNLFGPRDQSYILAGIEFIAGRPRTRFCLGNNIIIQLHTSTMFDQTELLRELAHETVHILSPLPGRPVKIIEEGMAECFSYLYMRDTMKIRTLPPSSISYSEAQWLVSMLLTLDPYAIKRIREDEPVLSKITKSLILKHYPAFDEGMAARLTRTFVWDGCDDSDILKAYDTETVE